MHPDIVALLARQHGLVTHRQLVAAGVDARQLAARRGRASAWVAVRRSVYAPADRWSSADDVGRWRLRDAAASLAMRREHLLSHDSAARAHGLDQLAVRRPLVHVTRPGVHGSRTEHGVRHHLTRVPLEPAPGVPGPRCTGLARTSLDVAREHGALHGVVVVDQALRRGVACSALRRELAAMTFWPGVSGARVALDLADPGAESLGESAARLLVTELGLGRPQTQFAVRLEGGRTAWCDLRIGCHVFEFDGMVKYRRRDQGGVATRDAAEVAWEERMREQLVMREGLGLSRIVWDELWHPRRESTKARLHREYADTLQRHGSVLPPHLREYDARVRSRRVPPSAL